MEKKLRALAAKWKKESERANLEIGKSKTQKAASYWRDYRAACELHAADLLEVLDTRPEFPTKFAKAVGDLRLSEVNQPTE